ncbi:MAG: GNAT family N-acetyltransferase [Actinobacteria bacterium]|nr:GNAT family N-acetyltransferase [Actinomycetota bacterium]
MALRLADARDLAALEGMLLEAVNWSRDREPLTLEQLRKNDILIRYVEEWPRDGDAGVIAEKYGGVVGAAWFRRFARDRPGFGFIDESTPEVSVAVASVWRGRGIGSQLLTALIEIGRERGFEGLSLSVESRNRAVRLYRHLGFVVAVDKNSSYTMRLQL